MKERILIAEDDPQIAQIVRECVEGLGYSPEVTVDGAFALQHGIAGEFKMMILDLELAKLDGLEVCRLLRESRGNLPVLLLTSQNENPNHRLELQSAGSYLPKPFDVQELTARVQALLRCGKYAKETRLDEVVIDGSLELRATERKLLVRGVNVELTVLEFDLLKFFVFNPSEVFSRAQLLEQVWETVPSNGEQAVTATLGRLRKKLEHAGPDRELFATIRGVGYRYLPLS